MKAGTLTGAFFLLIGGIAWLKSSQRQKLSCCGLLNGASSPVSSCEARPGSRRKLPASQGNRGYLGGNQAQEFLTTSFLAFSGLKMPKTTSLEIPGLDSPLSSLDAPLTSRQFSATSRPRRKRVVKGLSTARCCRTVSLGWSRTMQS